MSMEAKVVTVLIKYLWYKYPFLMKEVVIGHDQHIHKNPKSRKRTAHAER